ncbi:kurz protein, putative [Trichomonas vaginalis G3]|uniref:RNA helicase n=1 Tax=Trichomonas vaginalis (strain ATCC PRA-98 / G3) TaxID=412133 RepID=A2DK16_TRIV3|nr:ATP-dependent RNA helicase family [Trichomonas vaginalis G3]EAY19187.1 kurz protein, putative [Trichomonas vaginalis G3]KAI5548471.1 ATP-dependent RNA helicase family [Trichomonas vaginalis G3]|eukprot:XP_001580173.1 kurz protein [Trichomonas vaginalis G3]
MSNIISEELKKELGEGDDIVIDPEAGPKEQQEQKLNKHQLRKQRNQERKIKSASNSSEKAKIKKEKIRLLQEKRARVGEVIANFKQNAVSKQTKEIMATSSSIGVKKTENQLYKEALHLRELNLPYDKEIIEKIEKKKKEKADRIAAMPAFVPIQKSEEEIPNREEPVTTEKIQQKQAAVFKPLIPPSRPELEKRDMPSKITIRDGKQETVHLDRPQDVIEVRKKLPIIGQETEILESIRENDIIIIQGDTGSGKTTQVPQFLYEAGYGTFRAKGKIVVTEPRRVAAINMSKRVAYEMGFRHGAEVGFQIRDQHLLTDATTIKFVTDGVLLKELESDLFLSSYSVVIIDEAHERTVNTDVLIGLLSKIVKTRRERSEKDSSIEPLKLIIMSATLRSEDFTKNEKLFEVPPKEIKVPGRMYPVTDQYPKDTPAPENVNKCIKNLVDHLHETLPDGSILVFVPGKSDINELVGYFRSLPTVDPSKSNKDKPKDEQKVTKGTSSKPETEKPKEQKQETEENVDEDDENEIFIDDSGKRHRKLKPIENFEDMMYGNLPPVTSRKPMLVLPLYSLLDPYEQEKVFKDPPKDKRVIIFSTNVAETSLTIPGVRYVVDSGLEKVRVYDFSKQNVNAKVQYISKASAKQRKGRAGRTSPGYCFRLYSQAYKHNAFEKYSPPEILKRPITEVVLLLKSMGLNDISKFPFPTQINEENIKQSELILQHLGAIETETPRKITQLGRIMVGYPLDPRLSKILIMAKANGLLDYAAVIVGVLSVREPFESNSNEKSDNALDVDADNSDILYAMKMFCAWQYEQPEERQKFCLDNNLRPKAMEEIQNIRFQLKKLLVKNKIDICITSLEPTDSKQANKLRQAILCGYPDHVAHQVKGNEYVLLDGTKSFLPGNSQLIESPPKYVVYIDNVSSDGRNRLQNPSQIAPQWLMLVGSPLFLVKTNQQTPYYDPLSDRVVCKTEGEYKNSEIDASMAAQVGKWNIPATPCEVQENKYMYFAQGFLKGDVFEEIKQLHKGMSMTMINNYTAPNNNKIPQKHLAIASVLKSKDISTKAQLIKELKQNPTFLLNQFMYWLEEEEYKPQAVNLWKKFTK